MKAYPHRRAFEELKARAGRPTRHDPLAQRTTEMSGVWAAREDEQDERQKARDANWHWKAQYVHPPFLVPKLPDGIALFDAGFACYAWDEGRYHSGTVMLGWDKRLKVAGWL